MKISKKEFKKLYDQSLADILAVRPLDGALADALAAHDQDFKNFNFLYYLKQSWFRAWKIYNLLPDNSDGQKIRVLDLGAFFGNFALCLKRLGYEVVIAEVYEYYQNAFDQLKLFLENEGLKVLNLDCTAVLSLENFNEKYDVVLCLAILEHLAESPKRLMSNIQSFLSSDGAALIEVPNIAYWPNRIKLLMGRSILPSIGSIYVSQSPFMGHYHEYTAKEVKLLAKLAGFKIRHLVCYNYSAGNLIELALRLPIFFFSSCREIILAKLAK